MGTNKVYSRCHNARCHNTLCHNTLCPTTSILLICWFVNAAMYRVMEELNGFESICIIRNVANAEYVLSLSV